MPTHDDDFLDSTAIVPDTEDRATHLPPSRTASARPGQKRTGNASGAGKQIFVLLGFAALLAIAGFLHYRITQQMDANAKLQTRLETLEAQLGVTPADSSKAGETMGDKIKILENRLNTANGDIAKLSASINEKTRKTLDDHEKSLASLQSSIADIKKSMAQDDKQAGETAKIASEGKQAAERANNFVAEINGTISTLQQRLAQGDPVARDASQQATMALEQNDQLQKKFDGLNKRVSDQEETLRSIDSFRRSVNSDLNKLKQDHVQGPAIPPQ